MEVEVKLRLPNSEAHQALSSVLSPYLTKTHFQHNVFFDGANSELSSQRAVLRIRFYGEDPESATRCVLGLKAKAVIVDGVSRVAEDEEEIDPALGREMWADPSLIGSVETRVLRRVREEFGVNEGVGCVCLGGFKNVRGVYEWNGLMLEVDETLFDFGTLYEVECESAQPDTDKEIIEGFLKENGIPYSYSKTSKFAIFRAGKLPHQTMNVVGGDAISASSPEVNKPLWHYVTKLQKYGGGGNVSFRCNYCQVTYKGSYSRVKAHLLRLSGHGIKQCPSVNDEHLLEMQKLVNEAEPRFKKALPQTFLLPPPPSQSSSSSAERAIGLTGQEVYKFKKRKTAAMSDLVKACDEQAKEHLDGEIARMFFSTGLPFNLAENVHYKNAFTFAANKNITGYVPPDPSYLGTYLLDKERTRVEKLLEPIKGKWKEKGVTLVCSGWTNLQRSIVNFLAVSDRAIFLKAVNCAAESVDRISIFGLIKDVIMEVGPTNVVQVITENAPVCKDAGLLIEDSCPPVFWTPCLAHALDVALRNICCPRNTKDNEVVYRELKWIAETITSVQMVKNFIMNHMFRPLLDDLLDLKMLSLSETQLGYVVLLLRRFYLMKDELQSMISNDNYAWFCGSGSETAEMVRQKLSDDSFWEKINYILSFTQPAFDMLKVASSSKLSLHLVYETWGSMMAKVNTAISKHEKKVKKEDSKFWYVIHRTLEDEWAKNKSPLYGLAHTLNPRYSCKQWLSEDVSHTPPYKDPEISSMRKICLRRYFPDEEERRVVNLELCKFFESVDEFSDEDSLRDRLELDALSWWLIHGASAPLLQNVAIRLLGQPCSSWCSEQIRSSTSLYEQKGKITSRQDEDSMFVHMNLQLLSRKSHCSEDDSEIWDVCGESADSRHDT